MDALLGLAAYALSGGTEGLSPDVFEQLVMMLDNDMIKIGNSGTPHGGYDRKTGIVTLDVSDWKRYGLPGSTAGVISYLFHEVGHATLTGSGDFTERYNCGTGSSALSGDCDRKGWDTQLTYWRFISGQVDTHSGLNSEVNERYKNGTRIASSSSTIYTALFRGDTFLPRLALRSIGARKDALRPRKQGTVSLFRP